MTVRPRQCRFIGPESTTATSVTPVASHGRASFWAIYTCSDPNALRRMTDVEHASRSRAEQVGLGIAHGHYPRLTQSYLLPVRNFEEAIVEHYAGNPLALQIFDRPGGSSVMLWDLGTQSRMITTPPGCRVSPLPQSYLTSGPLGKKNIVRPIWASSRPRMMTSDRGAQFTDSRHRPTYMAWWMELSRISSLRIRFTEAVQILFCWPDGMKWRGWR